MNAIVISAMLIGLLSNFTTRAVAGSEDEGGKHAMSEYMLILHETPSDFAGASVEEIQRIIREYVAWKEKIEAEGRFAGSNKLADEGGRHLTMRDGQLRVTDGPYVEAKEVMGGYFIVRASSYEEAVEIARTCPHLKYGGRIEVRQVEEVGGAAAPAR